MTRLHVFPAFVLLFAASSAMAQYTTPMASHDPHEVRLPSSWVDPEDAVQSRLRATPFWQGFKAEHDRWQVIYDQSTGAVHRAFGPAIPTPDAPSWLESQLTEMGWNVSLSTWRSTAMGRHTLHRTTQTVNGRTVFGSEFVVKEGEQGVIMWGAQAHAEAAWPENLNPLSPAEVEAAASAGLSLSDMVVTTGEEWLMPVRRLVPERVVFDFRPAIEIRVRGRFDDGTPVDYRTLVDLETGEVLLRQNQVKHIGGPTDPCKKRPLPMGPPALMQMLSCQVTGTVHLTQPFEEAAEVGLGHLQAQTTLGIQNTDPGGMLTLDDGVPQEMGLALQGSWSTVTTNGETPTLDVVINGDTTVSFDGTANIRELSAYHSVNRIHDHMQGWLPDFDGLDFSLPTLVDVSGTCNAFYTPGDPTINFYSNGDGCNAFSLVSDVVFHEYGHGINDLYYQSLGGFFTNGGINEGYADFWSISLSGNPILGQGCYEDEPTFFIRRYDVDAKVYPQDLVGQVHADGEIICGAWYDTHLLMGGDWNATMALFTSAYAGLQAQTQNGNEGEAFVEILLDALQADDDDDDLSNGTPNGDAILEGFGMHGITLFSSVDIVHESEGTHPEEETIAIEAEAEILFPFGQYFSSCNLYYRTHPGDDWTSMPMTAGGNDAFLADIPAQPAGTVVEYHFGIEDLFGAISAIHPYSADDAANPNLPHNLIVGVEPLLIDDQDDYADFGFWSIGLPEDNATTGQWDSAIPVGSYSDFGDPSSICAPAEDHTPGDGLYAFITGVSPGADAGIGSNDVDDGSTTLQSEPLDISDLEAPVLSYWRWYVNAPASGANPGADWWQVHVSSDGGDNWVEIEETLTQDISWRRNAFAIEDYVPLTSEFQIRFVASDSLRPNQGLEYDGGSLIEAAVDDLVIYDLASNSVVPVIGTSGIVAWPVPARDVLHAAGWLPGALVTLSDAAGRQVAEVWADALGQVRLSVPDRLSGWAVLSGAGRSGEIAVKKVVLQGN